MDFIYDSDSRTASLPSHLPTARRAGLRPPGSAGGRRRVAGAGLATVLSLIITACSGPPSAKATANGSPSAPASAAPTASATPTASETASVTPIASGAMSADELRWLDGIAALHKTMDDVPATLNSATMRTLADRLGGCTRALENLGSRTTRLQPVYRLSQQGCARYEKGSQCFATAASLGLVVAGSPEDRTQTDAITCGIASIGDGSKLLAEAEAKGFDVRDLNS